MSKEIVILIAVVSSLIFGGYQSGYRKGNMDGENRVAKACLEAVEKELKKRR